jgi:hypothetical protein
VHTRLVTAAAAICLLAATTWHFFWDPKPSFEAASNDGASLTEPAAIETFAQERIFFGHMSVGNNILSGLQQVRAIHDVDLPEAVEIEPGEAPSLPPGGMMVHAQIGENRDPSGKFANFERTLRAGVADQVDVAALKLCYIDVLWDTDVTKLFEQYRQMISRLEAAFPDVRFVHMTVPLTTGSHGIKDHLKVLAGRDDNAARERYNDLIRDTYGPDEVFDIAAVESTQPDGSSGERALFEGYTSDGAHLNATGSARVAAEFINFLADAEA